MDIVIPTLGRALNSLQHTYHQLLDADICATLIVQPQEARLYEHIGDMMVLPQHIKGIAATRDWIVHDMKSENDHVLMLDDDLHFAVRRDDERDKFRQPERKDIRAMIDALAEQLELYPHVAIGSREGGNRVTSEHVWNTRMMRVLGYRRSYLIRNKIWFSPMEVMEDFHVTLQILRQGEDCCVLNNWVSNQAGGSDAKGGCSTFRTLELHAENAHRLAARHPGFVKVVDKQTKTAWGGRARKDVVVQWKAAAAAGKRSKA